MKIIYLALFLLAHQAIAQVKEENFAFNIAPKLVAIQVADIDSSVNWYKNNLGFKLKDRKDLPENGLKISFLEFKGFDLELVENNKSVSKDILLQKYPEGSEIRGFAKLTFKVDNIELADKHLKKTGAKYLFSLRPANIPGKSNQKWLIVTDPDGNWIQLVSE